MHDRTAMTHKFAFSLDAELCRPSSQRPDAAHRPWLDWLNEATRRQHLHYKSLQGSWNLSEYAQRKLAWLRESCAKASLGPDGTIGFTEITGSDAEPYFSVSMQEPVPTTQSCPYPLSFALLTALEKDALSLVEALGCPPSTVIMRCIGDYDVEDSSLLIDGEQVHVSFADLEENKGLIVSETLDGMCFLEWTNLNMAFAYLARTLALHDDPGWKPVDPSRDPDRWLHVEWKWSEEPGNWTRRSRILEVGEYWCGPDPTDSSGRYVPC